MRAVVVFATFLCCLLPAYGAHVTITSCPKSLMSCDGSDCVSTTIPEMTCQATGNNSRPSQSFTCIPFAAICARIAHYTGDSCAGSPIAYNDIVCGQCYAQREGGYVRPDCLYDNAGQQYTQLVPCSDSACTSCYTPVHIKQGQCFPDHSRKLGNGTSIIMGYEVCSILSQAQYTSTDCTGAAMMDYLPSNRCIEGTRLTCQN